MVTNIVLDYRLIFLETSGEHDREEIASYKVAQLALKYGYKYSPRLQINLFGNEWGT